VFVSLFAFGQDHNSLWLTDGLQISLGMKAEQLRRNLPSDYSIRIDRERTWTINHSDRPIGHIEFNKDGLVWQISKYYDNADENTAVGFEQFFRILERIIWTESGKLEIPPFPTSIHAMISTYDNKEQQQQSIYINVGKRSFDITIYRGGSYAPSVTFQEFITDYKLAGIK